MALVSINPGTVTVSLRAKAGFHANGDFSFELTPEQAIELVRTLYLELVEAGLVPPPPPEGDA